ncbi:MAG: DivIVA domain-containing protein [Candidatus Eremiobacteraeota bacterium]|nr:DivIVA domain-containing protein [Candidatus Eremiobacteraeota bacterium]
MAKITIVDIQHKAFKKKLNGYDPTDVDQFLDELIETLEDESQQRAALDAEASDLRERISHFKAMEESLQKTLLLAQRTADEVKASAHREADLIRHDARMQVEKEIAAYGDRTADARREHQHAIETTEKARSELRSLLMTHLALLDRPGAFPIPTHAPAGYAGNGAAPENAASERAGNGVVSEDVASDRVGNGAVFEDTADRAGNGAPLEPLAV